MPLQHLMAHLGVIGVSSRTIITEAGLAAFLSDLEKLSALSPESAWRAFTPVKFQQRHQLAHCLVATQQADETAFISWEGTRHPNGPIPGAVGNAPGVLAGALAYEVARQLRCMIHLWCVRTTAEKASPTGTLCVTRRKPEARRLEHHVFYPDYRLLEPGAADRTIFDVAHELAHLQLNHPPGYDPRSEAEECAAHCFAATFLASCQSGTGLTPDVKVLRRAVGKAGLTTGESAAVMSALLSGPGVPGNGTLECLDLYNDDEQHRVDAELELEAALTKAFRPQTNPRQGRDVPGSPGKRG